MKKLKIARYIITFFVIVIITTGCQDKRPNKDITKEEDIKSQEQVEPKDVKESDSIDVNLTSMSSTMIYAEVFQMMMQPELYIDKVIRVKGHYFSSYYEPKNQYYHYVLIKDASACCSQGLEFIWEDGSHCAPDEYPKGEAEVEVTGVFEVYYEEGDSTPYYRLGNATLHIMNEES